MATKLETSLSGFNRALHRISAVSNKTFEEELNRNMLKLCIGAKGVKGLVQLTKKATEDGIRADLARPYRGGRPLSHLLAVQSLKRRGQQITTAAIAQEENKIIQRRVGTRAYMAASWLFSALSLAPHVKGAKLTRMDSIPQKPGGSAAKADAQAATKSRLKCTVFNTAEGAALVGSPAVPRALNQVRRDMEKYTARKMGEAYAKSKATS